MPEDLLTCYQKEFLASAKKVAIQMGEMGRNGRAPTGVIGELSACEKLGLKWKRPPMVMMPWMVPEQV